MKTVFKDVALIIGKKRRILTARKPKGEDYPHDWELPQVTAEKEEDPQKLKEYLRKTFRVRSNIKDLFKEAGYHIKRDDCEYKVVLRIYHTELLDPVVKSDDHIDLSWVRVHNYDNIHWALETRLCIKDIQMYIISY